MKLVWTAALLVAAGGAFAKLPPLDDAAKAKAAETAAKNAWQAKVDGYLLCKAQDKVAARFGAGKTSAKATPAAAASAAAVPAVAAPAVAASGTTPVSTAAIPPCLDPGPFAYNPPDQKPLETSGAHSPTGTAASPPSVKQDSAEMKPAQKKKP
jgi:hypothetical protein